MTTPWRYKHRAKRALRHDEKGQAVSLGPAHFYEDFRMFSREAM